MTKRDTFLKWYWIVTCAFIGFLLVLAVVSRSWVAIPPLAIPFGIALMFLARRLWRQPDNGNDAR